MLRFVGMETHLSKSHDNSDSMKMQISLAMNADVVSTEALQRLLLTPSTVDHWLAWWWSDIHTLWKETCDYY
jgi:hypothetical protein